MLTRSQWGAFSGIVFIVTILARRYHVCSTDEKEGSAISFAEFGVKKKVLDKLKSLILMMMWDEELKDH